jgi:hypothetical protein
VVLLEKESTIKRDLAVLRMRRERAEGRTQGQAARKTGCFAFRARIGRAIYGRHSRFLSSDASPNLEQVSGLILAGDARRQVVLMDRRL